MATGDTILVIPPQDFFPENSGNPSGGEFGLITNGLAKCLAFGAGVTTGADVIKRMPGTASLGTGATVKILLSDDAANPSASKVVEFGVNFGVLGTTGAYVAPAAAALGTEATGTCTLPSTSGQTIELSIAITAANMASCATNKWALFRLRRIGAAGSSDTAPGRILVHGVTVTDT